MVSEYLQGHNFFLILQFLFVKIRDWLLLQNIGYSFFLDFL